MLTVITADRLLSIVFAFRCSRLTLRGTYIICAVVWLCGTAIAVVPAFDTPYFFNEERRYGFYGKDCSALSYHFIDCETMGHSISLRNFYATSPVWNQSVFVSVISYQSMKLCNGETTSVLRGFLQLIEKICCQHNGGLTHLPSLDKPHHPLSWYSHIPKVNNIYFMDKGTLLVAFPFLPSPLITGYV